MEIIACPKCGSRRIYQGTLGDGVLTGYTSREVCHNCGFQGMPLIFDSEEDYINFLENLPKKTMIKENKPIIKDKEKRKMVKTKRPVGIIILSFILIFQAILFIDVFFFNWKYLFIPIWLFAYYLMVFSISAVILPYGFIKGKTWSYTLGGILFGFSIPIGLIFLYYLTRPHLSK